MRRWRVEQASKPALPVAGEGRFKPSFPLRMRPNMLAHFHLFFRLRRQYIPGSWGKLPMGYYFTTTPTTSDRRARYYYDTLNRVLPPPDSFPAHNSRYTSCPQFQQTGMYYYGRRLYSPGFGRCLSRDPLGDEGLNRTLTDADYERTYPTLTRPITTEDALLLAYQLPYTYVANNPLDFVDPLGLAACPAGQEEHTNWGQFTLCMGREMTGMGKADMDVLIGAISGPGLTVQYVKSRAARELFKRVAKRVSKKLGAKAIPVAGWIFTGVEIAKATVTCLDEAQECTCPAPK